MTETAIENYNPAGGSQAVVIGGHVLAFQEFAKVLAFSDLLPPGLAGKPANVFLALMQGLDLGLRPMQSMNLIDVIKGKPCMNAQGMRGLIIAAGHELNIAEWTDEKCVIEGRRASSTAWREASFTIEQAQKAGLAGDNWKKYPADMLLARATSRLAKAYFADVTNGLSTIEELIDVADGPSVVSPFAVSTVDPEQPVDAAVLAAEVADIEAGIVDVEVVEDEPTLTDEYVCQSCGVPGMHLTEACPEAAA